MRKAITPKRARGRPKGLPPKRVYRLIGPFGEVEQSRKRDIIRVAKSKAANEGGQYSVFTVDEGQTPQLIFQCHALTDKPRSRNGKYRVQVDEL